MNAPADVDDFAPLAGLGGELHLAIGVFDGVHLGHKAVIESAVFSARPSGGLSAVLTFHPHPSRLFKPEAPTRLIMGIGEKTAMLHEVGVDYVIRKAFDREFASIPADGFLAHLKRAMPALHAVYIGENFRFGRGRAGGVETLIASGRELEIGVFSVDRIKHNGEAISSTRIRDCLRTGAMSEANDLLGYNYFSRGQIVGGKAIGRSIGFPTLNLPWDPECRPCFGVYLVRVRPEGAGDWAYAVANYGTRPTVSGEAAEEPVLEVHFLDTKPPPSVDAIRVEWLRFIRPERKFDSLDALKERIGRDCEAARAFIPHG